MCFFDFLSQSSGDRKSKKRKPKGSTGEPELKAPPTGHVPVETATVLPDSSKVDGLTELKTYLLTEKKDAFAKTFVRKLMSYGLGRSLELGDREDIDALVTAFRENDYRMKPLIRAFVLSHAFQTK